jgi:hypothetical protein
MAATVVCGTAVHFPHAFQVQRNARGLYEYALVKEKEGATTPAR